MHSGSSPLRRSKKPLEYLLHTEGVDFYATLAVTECSAPEGYHPRDILPSAKTVIVFGLEIPAETFSLTSREKTERLHRVIERLDEIAFSLAKALEEEGHSSIAVPSFFPVRVRDRRIRGYLSLKHLAAEAGMGSIGQNTLLITSRSGNRVALGAVVTEKELHVEKPAVPPPQCRRCNRCIKACPTGALTEEGVDVLRCRNVTHAIPAPVRPIFNVLFGSNAGASLTEWLINRMAWDAEMVCSRCLTEWLINRMAWDAEMVCSRCLTVCPYFREPDAG